MEEKNQTISINDIANDIQNILAKYNVDIYEINKVLDKCSEIIKSRTVIKSTD